MKWRWHVLIFFFSFLSSWVCFATVWYTIAFVHGDLNQPAPEQSAISLSQSANSLNNSKYLKDQLMIRLNDNSSYNNHFIDEKEFLFKSVDMLNRSVEFVEYLIKNFNLSNANSLTYLSDNEKNDEKHEHVPCGKLKFANFIHVYINL